MPLPQWVFYSQMTTFTWPSHKLVFKSNVCCVDCVSAAPGDDDDDDGGEVNGEIYKHCIHMFPVYIYNVHCDIHDNNKYVNRSSDETQTHIQALSLSLSLFHHHQTHANVYTLAASLFPTHRTCVKQWNSPILLPVSIHIPSHFPIFVVVVAAVAIRTPSTVCRVMSVRYLFHFFSFPGFSMDSMCTKAHRMFFSQKFQNVDVWRIEQQQQQQHPV